jgi:hypothetical protein
MKMQIPCEVNGKPYTAILFFQGDIHRHPLNVAENVNYAKAEDNGLLNDFEKDSHIKDAMRYATLWTMVND